MNSVYLLLALTAGAALATQVVLNAQLRSHVGTPIQAAFVSLSVGAIAALAYSLLARFSWPSLTVLASAPPHVWLAGLLGVFYLWATVVVSPRLGVAVTFGLVIGGQVMTSMAIDTFGLLGASVHAASPGRIIGVALILCGVAAFTISK